MDDTHTASPSHKSASGEFIRTLRVSAIEYNYYNTIFIVFPLEFMEVAFGPSMCSITQIILVKYMIIGQYHKNAI